MTRTVLMTALILLPLSASPSFAGDKRGGWIDVETVSPPSTTSTRAGNTQALSIRR